MNTDKCRFISHIALVSSCVWLHGCAAMQNPATTAMPESYHDFQIHMADAKNGWMEANRPEHLRVLHTVDGGRSWVDVTPHIFTNKIWSCEFPKSEMAWVSYDDYDRTHWLLTTNAGKSWAPWKPLGDFNNDTHNFFLGGEEDELRFFTPKDGLVKLLDVGACQAEYNFFESHDGGMSWQPAPVTQAGWTSNELPGTFHLGDCDGSAISYYPPARTVIIANGDLMDETAKGVVRLNITQDAGQTWRNLELPLPDKYRDGLVASYPPHFFDKQNALLPVQVEKWDSPDSWTNVLYRVLIFYATTDGGNTWTLKPSVLDCRSPEFDSFDCVSPEKILLHRGGNLYATQDGVQSWQMLKPGISVGQQIAQTDFVDEKHGWMVAFDPDNSLPYFNDSLYRTKNGGASWEKLPWKIRP